MKVAGNRYYADIDRRGLQQRAAEQWFRAINERRIIDTYLECIESINRARAIYGQSMKLERNSTLPRPTSKPTKRTRSHENNIA